MKVNWKGRDIDIIFANVHYDHDYWCDTYIESAIYEDTSEDVPEDILEEMQNSIDMYDWIQEYLF